MAKCGYRCIGRPQKVGCFILFYYAYGKPVVLPAKRGHQGVNSSHSKLRLCIKKIKGLKDSLRIKRIKMIILSI